jgi:transcriptional regulator with XRE-family HTH domain
MTGRELRALRKAAGHTQASLAAKLAMNANTIAILERGERPIRAVVALAVAHIVCSSLPKPKTGGRSNDR